MLIQKRNIFTGLTRVLDIPITKEQYDRWQGGELIQKAMPHLTADQREFMISGTLPHEWDEHMKDES